MRLFARADGRRWALALVLVVGPLGCGRLGFEAVEVTSGDGGADSSVDAGPLVCEVWGPVELVPTLSSLSTDFGPSLTSNGAGIFLHSDRVGSRDIYAASVMGSGFEPPEGVGDINDPGADDGNPTTTADDAEIFFDSHRVAGMPCIYWWNLSTVVRLDALCTNVSAAGPHISEDGLRLYYTRLLGGNVEGTLMISTRTDRTDVFDAGVPLPGVWLGGVEIGYPSLTANELEIYFESGNPLQLYTARRDAVTDPFGTPELLTAINSPNQQADADISSDGQTLYMASDRAGGLSGASGYDIWRTTRTCN